MWPNVFLTGFYNPGAIKADKKTLEEYQMNHSESRLLSTAAPEKLFIVALLNMH